MFKNIVLVPILIIGSPVILLGFLYQFMCALFSIGRDITYSFGDWLSYK